MVNRGVDSTMWTSQQSPVGLFSLVLDDGERWMLLYINVYMWLLIWD
ncbi:unnamed protein product [Prunus brigantina]